MMTILDRIGILAIVMFSCNFYEDRSPCRPTLVIRSIYPEGSFFNEPSGLPFV